LAADLREVTLLEAVLLHQGFQGLHAGGLGQRVMLGFVVLDQIAHDVDQSRGGMGFVALGFIQQASSISVIRA
jgi:hypothetical protein